MSKRPGLPFSEEARRPTPVSSKTAVGDDFGLPSPRTEESSHDGTVILPTPLSEGALARFQPPDAFPTFRNGDVLIHTDLGPAPRTFQLHSSVLCRHSPFLAMEMEPGETWYHFAIEEVDENVSLVRKPANGDRPIVPQDNIPAIDGTHIKVEDPSEIRTPPLLAPSSTALVSTKNHTQHSTTIACYTQILASFYNIPPKISPTSILTALTQSEHLTALATNLGCVHLLQAHLANTFATFRQDLYFSIAQDPPRWLHLSLALENRAIYTECLIHLIGAHPKKPWPTQPSTPPIPDTIQHIVASKAEELTALRKETERQLLLITLHITDPYTRTPRPLDPRNAAERETWMAVQLFRDEFAQHIAAVEKHATPELHWGSCTAGFMRGVLNGWKRIMCGRCWRAW